MDLHLWLSFVLVVIAAVLSPGPAVLLAVSMGGQFGPKRAAFAVLGNVTGLAILITLTAFGLGAILSTSGDLFFWLRIAGGAYLIFLGVRLLLNRGRALPAPDEAMQVLPKRRAAYLQGIGVALSNPKAILLIGALFPQFIDVAQPVGPQFAILGATLITGSFTALMVYAAMSGALVGRGKRVVSTKLNKISGALFVLFGLALASGAR